MISKNILVDTTLIGTIQFYTYVFNDQEGKIGFGLFPNNSPDPLVYLLNIKDSKLKLFYNDDLILWICIQSQFKTEERRSLFKIFLDYVSKMEKKAANMIFKDKKMTYLADSREMLKYKRLYIHYNNQVKQRES